MSWDLRTKTYGWDHKIVIGTYQSLLHFGSFHNAIGVRDHKKLRQKGQKNE